MYFKWDLFRGHIKQWAYVAKMGLSGQFFVWKRHLSIQMLEGRTDRRTDGSILICHPKFLRGHKKLFIYLLAGGGLGGDKSK